MFLRSVRHEIQPEFFFPFSKLSIISDTSSWKHCQWNMSFCSIGNACAF